MASKYKHAIELLHKEGMTQTEIAEALGISQSGISIILNGSEVRNRSIRDYQRKNYLWAGDKTYRKVVKRDWTGQCEICGRDGNKYKLCYHHWDDSKPQLGIWVCMTCHNMCECMDKNLHDRYSMLKEEIHD